MKILSSFLFFLRSPYLDLNWRSGDTPQVITIKKDEFDEYYNFIDGLLKKQPSTNLNGKVYLGKLSDLPRHKVKDYFQNNNTKKTSRLEQSETIILNKKYLSEFVSNFKSKYDNYGAFSLKDIYSIENTDDKKILLDKYYSKWRKIENLSNPFLVGINEIDRNNGIPPNLKKFLSDKPCESLYVKSLYKENSLIELVYILNYIKSNPHVNLIFDEDFLLTLNEDGFELDEDYLNTLDNMFASKSQDNINLALEMLSNINIEKHSLTIALLLNKHNRVFSWGSGLSLNNNRSFKSILKYFESKNISFGSDWRSFIINLYKLHKDNPENVKIIQEFTRQNINEYLKAVYGSNNQFIELNSNDFKFNI